MKQNKFKKQKKRPPTLTEKERLEGSKFRILNEKLYTTTSDKAKQMFDEHPEYFDIMHRGFTNQATTWPIVPVDYVIKWIQTNHHPPEIIADMGCGEAKISASVPNKVYSFDFKAKNDKVIECDMSHTPLENESVDVVVFVLSLMGTNLGEFIQEARRIIKKSGRLLIIEVTSRIDDLDTFVKSVEERGFHLASKKDLTNYFVCVEFTVCDPTNITTEIKLKPCIYKRR
ncbi:ribosomal RNA-processing protein 8 [Histomonas meleagridis]|uniref:ribosomal RNA-processing protein 8 n=1 Tax=Histomonas meleagridis TaxID=135588 RepID=UPI00355A0481|nr:ribosomal RNA-processing protein 8 [Histomonas meleagridis]KAH0805663.1 ribosomal RNA-processing protein 8 [Histomonas meleagridis]